MPLNYSEKDTEDSASTVQTLAAPFYEMERKSHVLDTERFVCMKKSVQVYPGWQDTFLRQRSLLTVALETCLHTVAQL